MSAPTFRQTTLSQKLLGAFVVWQLLFLPLANLSSFVPHGRPEDGEISDSRRRPVTAESAPALQPAVDSVFTVVDRWAQLTGQVQAWWLFAPSFPTHSTFPAVTFRWDCEGPDAPAPPEVQPPVVLHTLLEPADPHHYLKMPGSFDRLFHYEIRLGLIFSGWDADSVARLPDEWQQATTERVRRQWRSMRAYLRWALAQFQREHPDLPPPSQAILSIRFYGTAAPPELPIRWLGPGEEPLARWCPGEPAKPGKLPLEVWDRVARRFAAVDDVN